eukprot:scaffold1034_cov175-Ochromonas_danica.AAC.20
MEPCEEGYEQHEIEGLTLKKLQGPLLSSLPSLHQIVERVRHHGQTHTEIIGCRREEDGAPFVCTLSVSPVMSPNYYGDYLLSHLVVTVKPLASATPSPLPFTSTALPAVVSQLSYNNGYDEDDVHRMIRSTNGIAAEDRHHHLLHNSTVHHHHLAQSHDHEDDHIHQLGSILQKQSLL